MTLTTNTDKLTTTMIDLSQEDIHTYLARHEKKELLRFLTCGKKKRAGYF